MNRFSSCFFTLIFFYCTNLTNAVFYKSNSTDLSKCSLSYSRSGSAYKEFYPIFTNEQAENASFIFDFHFAVLAASDAHILLAPSENVSKQDPVYEIVIGAGGNTFSDIRRMQKQEVKASVRIKNLLSALDPNFFWIHITKIGVQGLIEVGREGDNTSFISWMDPKPLAIKVIGFSTWSGIEAKWYFDCDRSGSEEEIEKKLTTYEKLRRDILYQYDPMTRPVLNESKFTNISISVGLDYLDLDEHRGTVKIIGVIKLNWKDEKISWDPNKYSGITEIHILQNEIWRPTLSCVSALDNPYHVLNDAIMVVNSKGEVTWKPVLQLESFCDTLKLGNWPRDTHNSTMIFIFGREYEKINLKVDENSSNLLQLRSSQWIILEATLFDSGQSGSYSGFFQLYFKVRRSSTIYSTIFFTPFLIIAVTLLLSFWVSPMGSMKIFMSCAQLILETLILLTLGMIVPSSANVPFLLHLYSWSLVASLLALIISIIVINISRKTQRDPLSHIICNILTTKFIRMSLQLPSVIMPDEYGHLKSPSVTNLTKSEEKDQTFWILLGTVIDRLAFIVYSGIISYVIIKYIVMD